MFLFLKKTVQNDIQIKKSAADISPTRLFSTEFLREMADRFRDSLSAAVK